MILKWKTPEGNWHLVDDVSNVINHGYLKISDIHELSKRYDGEDKSLYWTLDASSNVTEEQEYYNYVVATINGSREHMVMLFHDMYVLSDEGKTVDKFF